MTIPVTSTDLIERDKRVVTPAIYRYTDTVIVRGEGVFLFDCEGRRYYDMAAGIATMSVGHCHPRVVRAIAEQAQTLIHGASHVGYMLPYVQMVEKILSLAPAPLSTGKGVLVNSGSEAVETAIKLARAGPAGRWRSPSWTASTGGRWARWPSRPAAVAIAATSERC